MENEVVPVCDGVIIHPGTDKQVRMTWIEARRRGIQVDDPLIQSSIDSAPE